MKDIIFGLGFVVGVGVGILLFAIFIGIRICCISDETGEKTIKPNNVHYRLTLATDEQILKYEKERNK